MSTFLSRLFFFTFATAALYGGEPIRVYVDIVGDLFHYGHIEIFKKAKSLGDELVVGVHSDEEVERYKRRPIMSLEERVSSVQNCLLVDEVIPSAPLRITRDWIEKHRLDLVIHGDDIDRARIEEFYGMAVEMGIFRLVPYTEGISTTEIIRRIVNRVDLIEEYGLSHK